MPGGDSDLPLELVTWADAHKDDQTLSLIQAAEIAPEDYLVHTVGWVIRDDDVWLVVCHERFEDGNVRGTTAIPAGWVLNRKKWVSTPAKARKK